MQHEVDVDLPLSRPVPAYGVSPHHRPYVLRQAEDASRGHVVVHRWLCLSGLRQQHLYSLVRPLADEVPQVVTGQADRHQVRAEGGSAGDPDAVQPHGPPGAGGQASDGGHLRHTRSSHG
nr:hypothetical protein [Fodinicola feengrottensis]